MKLFIAVFAVMTFVNFKVQAYSIECDHDSERKCKIGGNVVVYGQCAVVMYKTGKDGIERPDSCIPEFGDKKEEEEVKVKSETQGDCKQAYICWSGSHNFVTCDKGQVDELKQINQPCRPVIKD